MFTRRIALFILFGLFFMVMLSTLADLGSIAALSAMTIEADEANDTRTEKSSPTLTPTPRQDSGQPSSDEPVFLAKALFALPFEPFGII